MELCFAMLPIFHPHFHHPLVLNRSKTVSNTCKTNLLISRNEILVKTYILQKRKHESRSIIILSITAKQMRWGHLHLVSSTFCFLYNCHAKVEVVLWRRNCKAVYSRHMPQRKQTIPCFQWRLLQHRGRKAFIVWNSIQGGPAKPRWFDVENCDCIWTWFSHIVSGINAIVGIG